ncbi:Magnesium transporter MRS2-B, partial [Tetrabaena socialis]
EPLISAAGYGSSDAAQQQPQPPTEDGAAASRANTVESAEEILLAVEAQLEQSPLLSRRGSIAMAIGGRCGERPHQQQEHQLQPGQHRPAAGRQHPSGLADTASAFASPPAGGAMLVTAASFSDGLLDSAFEAAAQAAAAAVAAASRTAAGDAPHPLAGPHGPHREMRGAFATTSHPSGGPDLPYPGGGGGAAAWVAAAEPRWPPARSAADPAVQRPGAAGGAPRVGGSALGAAPLARASGGGGGGGGGGAAGGVNAAARTHGSVSGGLQQRPPYQGGGGAAAGPEKKLAIAGVRTWLKVLPEGSASIVQLDRAQLGLQYGVQLRDFRVLDPVLGATYPACLLCREGALICNLDHIKVIITAQFALVNNAESDKSRPFTDELKRRLQHYATTKALAALAAEQQQRQQQQQQGPEQAAGSELAAAWADAASEALQFKDNGGVEGGPASGVARGPIAHVASALLSILPHVRAGAQQPQQPQQPQAQATPRAGLPIMAALWPHPSPHSGLGMGPLGALGPLPQPGAGGGGLSEGHVSELVASMPFELRALEVVLEQLTLRVNPRNLERMRHLKARMAALSNKVDTVGGGGGEPDSEEVAVVEMLLEAYFMQLGHTWQRLQSLKSYIDSTEDLINLELDQQRNNLISVDLMVTFASFLLTAMSVIAGLFGMNVTNRMETDYASFLGICIGASAAAVVLWFIFVYGAIRYGLMNGLSMTWR